MAAHNSTRKATPLRVAVSGDSASLRATLEAFDVAAHRAKKETYAAIYAPFGPAATREVFLRNFGIYDDVQRVSNPRGLSWEGLCEPFIALPTKA